MTRVFNARAAGFCILTFYLKSKSIYEPCLKCMQFILFYVLSINSVEILPVQHVQISTLGSYAKRPPHSGWASSISRNSHQRQFSLYVAFCTESLYSPMTFNSTPVFVSKVRGVGKPLCTGVYVNIGGFRFDR